MEPATNRAREESIYETKVSSFTSTDSNQPVYCAGCALLPACTQRASIRLFENPYRVSIAWFHRLTAVFERLVRKRRMRLQLLRISSPEPTTYQPWYVRVLCIRATLPCLVSSLLGTGRIDHASLVDIQLSMFAWSSDEVRLATALMSSLWWYSRAT